MLDFLRDGGPFMVLLVLTSVVAVTVIIERGLALRWPKVVPDLLEAAVENYRSPADLAALEAACREYPSALSRLLDVACQHLTWSKEENTSALETRARREVLLLERGLVVLEVAVGIAPLLGLVGTVYGLITLFSGMGGLASADNAKVAQGIAIALNTTLAGLMIAIPSLIAWTYFTKKVDRMAVELETICDDFLRRHYRQVKPAARPRATRRPAEEAPL